MTWPMRAQLEWILNTQNLYAYIIIHTFRQLQKHQVKQFDQIWNEYFLVTHVAFDVSQQLDRALKLNSFAFFLYLFFKCV